MWRGTASAAAANELTYAPATTVCNRADWCYRHASRSGNRLRGDSGDRCLEANNGWIGRTSTRVDAHSVSELADRFASGGNGSLGSGVLVRQCTAGFRYRTLLLFEELYDRRLW